MSPRARPPGPGCSGSRLSRSARRPGSRRPERAVSLASPRRPRHGAPPVGAPPDGIAQVRDATMRGPRPGGAPRPGRGTIARANPSLAASRRRRSRPERELAEQAHLADHDRAGLIGRSRNEDASARATAGPGRARRRTARRRDWRRHRGSRGRCRRAGRGRRRAGPSRLDRSRSPCARRAGAAGDQRLDLDQQRPAALQRRRDDAARRRAAVVGQERAGRVGDLEQAGLAHLEDADLLGRPEPVLGRAQEAQRGVALAVEADDRVDEVLEGLRPGDRAVLGDVPDEDDRRSRRPSRAP